MVELKDCQRVTVEGLEEDGKPMVFLVHVHENRAGKPMTLINVKHLDKRSAMAKKIVLPTYKDGRGTLTAFEDIPFEVKRCYWIYDTDHDRGGHKHKKTRQLLISLKGSVTVVVEQNQKTLEFKLDNPYTALLLEPEDYHFMTEFSPDNVLFVLASEPYDPEDYIY